MSEDVVVLVHARELDAYELATRHKHHMFCHVLISAPAHFSTFAGVLSHPHRIKTSLGLTDLFYTAFGPLGNSSNHLCRVLGLLTVVVPCSMGLKKINNIYSRRVIAI